MTSDVGISVESILMQAIYSRASDIHVEPGKTGMLIRFRIDGILQTYKELEATQQNPLISKIKVMSKMNISDHRLPQDGHIEFNYKSIIYNIRVSSLPTLYGETIVMRVLNRNDSLMKLDSLGLDQNQYTLLTKLITLPSGMILITGPTGSGKSNFLYSIIHTLNNPEKNIITLEDPVEYVLSGVNQCQINEAIDFSFSTAMRTVVRQDPNIIMLGEIRDIPTIQQAIQASLIGTLVLSTFHTFDVPALVTRFTEMGITNSIIAQAIQAVISTRLVRIICDKCKMQVQPTPTDRALLTNYQVATLYKGRGCEACKNTGYYGRTGIFEIVHFDPELRESIVDRQPATYIYNLIKKKQITNLYSAAMAKVVQGITTIDEAQKIVGMPI